MYRKIIFVDLDGVLADFDRAIKGLTWEQKELAEKQEGFFLNLEPIENALDSIRELDKNFNVFICSTAPWEAPYAWMEKRLWVEKYLPEFIKRLTLTHRKDLMRGNYIIDDRLKNGVYEFVGEHIHFGSPKFPNWKSVVEYLKDKEGF